LSGIKRVRTRRSEQQKKEGQREKERARSRVVLGK
jgi:hypothetical protein